MNGNRILLLLLLFLVGCSRPGVVLGSGNPGFELRDVSGFRQVEVTGAGLVLVERGERESLSVEADDNLLPFLTSDVVGDRLILGVRPGTIIQSSRDVVYRLTVVELEGVTLSGAGELWFDAVDAETLTVDISGSGAVELAGRAGRQRVVISGSGKYIAPELESRAAVVEVSGAGEATVNATETLDVTISGSGDVAYLGDPVVTQDISGSGTLQQR